MSSSAGKARRAFRGARDRLRQSFRAQDDWNRDIMWLAGIWEDEYPRWNPSESQHLRGKVGNYQTLERSVMLKHM